MGYKYIKHNICVNIKREEFKYTRMISRPHLSLSQQRLACVLIVVLVHRIVPFCSSVPSSPLLLYEYNHISISTGAILTGELKTKINSYIGF